MIDAARLKTPTGDGEVLVLPEPSAFRGLCDANRNALNTSEATILNRPIREWRQELRRSIAGSEGGPLVLTGHQPSFLHPGVWAKQVVARRFVETGGGSALNLVIDSDELDEPSLAVPGVHDGAVGLGQVPLPRQADVFVFEQLHRWRRDEVRTVGRGIQSAAGSALQGSLMPRFLAEVEAAAESLDGVDQRIAALRKLDEFFAVDVATLRISQAPVSPLLADMVLNAERFARSYNRALAWYRATYRVRGAQRPLPDLAVDAGRCEVAMWAYRAIGPRRRVFVARRMDRIRIFADTTLIGERSVADLTKEHGSIARFDAWRIRPRALATTTWARLMLADLFIHGIGGAKYDQVTDRILSDFYGVKSNEIACVSATLRLDLPRSGVTVDAVDRLRRAVRDWTYNPHRHAGAKRTTLSTLLERREAAVRAADALRATSPRDRAARRAAFREIRDASAAIRDATSSIGDDLRLRFADAEAALERDRVATGREYFLGLYDASTIHRLLEALPDPRAFSR